MTEEYTKTLNDYMQTKASEWGEPDLEAIVAALRNQRERWNAEQAAGSRKLVKSSQVTAGGDAKPQTLKQAIKGLKL